MKNWFLGFLVVFFSPVAFAQNRPAPAVAPEADVLSANKVLYQALLQEDVTAMGKILGTEYVLINSDGSLVDRETLIGAFRDGYVTLESGETKNEVAKLYGDVALVKGLWKSKRTVQGTTMEDQVYYTSVYAKRDGTWQAVSAQFTLVK
ncbi:MAG: nuclear transport factor 2 family protein [Ferruginibacter sp.]|nr:nuclear transport factor 2 family protein [Cytophagales bacterium]